ncbi:bacteriocin, lactococcin A1 family protein [Bacillus cereus]|nr:bacteriocin, lactococcin A1 family protein [Bacillus cereus]
MYSFIKLDIKGFLKMKELTEKELELIDGGGWANHVYGAGGNIAAGAGIGSAFGSVLPGVGTAAGAFVGGVYGGVGYAVGLAIDGR